MARHHTPQVLNDLRGNPGKRKRKEPESIDGVPKMPNHLDRIAKAKWKEMVKQLSQMRLLTASDGDALELYCVSYSRWRQALKELKEQGNFTEGASGHKQVSPASTIVNQTQEQCRKLLIMFGLSPSARAGMATPVTKADDKWANIKRAS